MTKFKTITKGLLAIAVILVAQSTIGSKPALAFRQVMNPCDSYRKLLSDAGSNYGAALASGDPTAIAAAEARINSISADMAAAGC